MSIRARTAVGAGVYYLTRPPWRPVPALDGLVAFLPGHQASTAWADIVLAHDQDGFVVWAATGTHPAPGVAAAAQRAGVAAISLAPAADDPRVVSLALRFARRLANIPRANDVRPPVTSPKAPEPAGTWVVLPHLLTICTATGAHTSTTVWELRARHQLCPCAPVGGSGAG